MPTTSRSSTVRRRVALAVVVLVALLAAGYHVGRDMAHRDKARAERR